MANRTTATATATAVAMAIAFTVAGGLSVCRAQPPRAMVDTVRTGENRQAEIRGDTKRTADDLDAIVAEFERNGLAQTADVQVLKSIRGVLGSLSEKEMAKVISLLQAARSAPNQSKATTSVSEAVQDQKTIIIQLQKLLLEFQRQQELTQLSIRFARLAEDQNKNMKAARSLAKVPKTSYTEQHNAMLSLQQSEQAAIRDQVIAQLKKLSDLGQDTESVAAEKIARVLEAANKADLVKTLAAAATDLNQGKLFSAATREKTGRDHLRDLARVVAPPKEPMALLQEAIEILGGAITEQQAIAAGVGTLEGEKPSDQSVEIEERQADLVDGTDIVRKDVEEIAPEAAGELRGAEDKMQSARAALSGSLRKDVASDNAAQAAKGLEKARQRLLDQLALLKQEAAKDVIAQTKDLKEQITALRAAEETLKAETVPATAPLGALGGRQGNLLKTARDLVLLVTVEAPAATAAMQDAARDMDSAQTAMGAAANRPDALKSEQSAIDNLLKAEKALEQQLAQLEKAQEDLAKLEKAREDLAKVIEKEQKAEAATAKLAAKEEQEKTQSKEKQEESAPERKADAEKIAKEQQAIAQQAEQVKQDIADVQKTAADALANAQQDLKNAEKNLGQQDTPKAQENAHEAMADMNKAKDALDERIADLQKQLDQQQDASSTLESIANQLEQAQKEVGEAQQMMDNAQPQMQPAAQKMDKVAGDLTKAVAEDKGALPKAAEQAVNEAQQALTKAAAAAEHDDPAQAKQQAEQAQQALAQAQAAVAMAKNGMPQGEKAEGQQAKTPGPPKPGEPGQKADERNAKKGKGDRKDMTVNADGKTGGVAARSGTAFTGLPAREREAILQDRKEKYPQEYGAMIENYTKGLSDSER